MTDLFAALRWVREHWVELVELAGLLWVLLSVFVALTPSRRDDAWLARVARRLSFLAPRDRRGIFSLPGRDPCPPCDKPEEPPT